LKEIGGPSSVMEKARGLWTDYTPRKKEKLAVAGVDSSWNLVPYLGYYVYAVDAVCQTQEGRDAVPPRFDVGAGVLSVVEGRELTTDPRMVLESEGMDLEYKMAKEGSQGSDFVLVDGSLLARFYDRRRRHAIAFYEHARDLMKERNVIFVSKRSESNKLFGAPVGDIHYFNVATSCAGYSSPYLDKGGVTVFYVRLSDRSPCLRVEAPGEVDGRGQRELMDALGSYSVDGYPYPLRVAHESCRISNEDMRRLVDILGLAAETGGREVLGE